jgi:hypothetical protein
MTERSELMTEWVALFASLADAQAALDAAQAAGAPYPALRLAAHTPDDLAGLAPAIGARPGAPGAAGQLWSLTLIPDAKWRDAALDALRAHHPIAIGQRPTDDNRRDDTERGAIAWRHYVFETDAATDAVGDGAGTNGTTGVINSGVFADGARAEGNPPARPLGPDDQRPSDADQAPTTDTKEPHVAKDRSRPDNKLTDR